MPQPLPLSTGKCARDTAMPRPESIHITGDRFEIAISGSRTKADVKDIRGDDTFILLDREAVFQLGMLLEWVMEVMDWKAETSAPEGRFVARVHRTGRHADLTDREHRRRMILLDREAVGELRELLERAAEEMGLIGMGESA